MCNMHNSGFANDLRHFENSRIKYWHIEFKVLEKAPHRCYLPYSEKGGLQGYALYFYFRVFMP